MSESYSKKEKTQKKAKSKQDKAEKMKERKANAKKGKSLEEMMAYIDENGNLSSTPPDMSKRKEINVEDIQLGATVITPEDELRTGRVAFFIEAKGYGFITDDKTKENIFVHNKHLLEPIKEKDAVTFEREKTAKGYSAINVRKVGKGS